MDQTRIIGELGANVRRFKSVQGCLLWYVEQRSKRMGRSISLEGGGGPTSQEQIDQAQATYARVAVCLVAWDRENDLEPDPLGDAAQSFARIDALAQWMRSSAERGQQRIADTVGLTMQGASKYFGRVESVLRRRMKARGLLEAS